MPAHKCNHEEEIKETAKETSKIGTLVIIQRILIGMVAVFLTIAILAFNKADRAVEKAAEANEKATEIKVIKNDVSWIKKHLEKQESSK